MIAALVLAAGRSGRFGGSKLVADFAGEPLVRAATRAILASRGVDEVVVVTGAGAEGDAVARALGGLGVRVVRHAGAADGMGTSIAAGVAALGPAARAVLVALGDQPTVPPEAVEAVIERWREAAGGDAGTSRDDGPPVHVVVPRYRGTRGHPVLFDAALFDELRTLQGDVGARGVVTRDEARVAFVELDLPLPPDVDTPEELAALVRPAR